MALTSTARRVLSGNTQLSNTGSTTENQVYSGTIPANSIGVNGSFHISALYSCTSNTNVKTWRIKFNGTVVATMIATTASVSVSGYNIIRNRNALNVQVSGPSTSNSGGTFATFSGTAVTTYAIDTAADIAVTITEQLATGTDTMAVEAFEIIAIP